MTTLLPYIVSIVFLWAAIGTALKALKNNLPLPTRYHVYMAIALTLILSEVIKYLLT